MKWSISSSQIQMVGGNQTAAENEDWIISKGFSLNSVRPDQGEVIKARYQFMVKDHYVVYDEPNTYHAVVVAKSGAGDAQVEIVQEFELTRSEEHRVGKEWVRKCRYRWAADH